MPHQGKEHREFVARSWVLDCGTRYWGIGRTHVAAITASNHTGTLAPLDADINGIGQIVLVPLPEWARDLGVDGSLLVDALAVAPGAGPLWQRCDWVKAAWLHLTGAPERLHEAAVGPIWSYAFRLGDSVDSRRFDHAWVNRVFLFLRRWAAHEVGVEEDVLFGSLPDAEIVLTHDVDAVKKTLELRAKQTAFSFWNAARAGRRAAFSQVIGHMRKGVRFAFGPGNFMTFGELRRLEDSAGLRSVLHFYGGPSGLGRRAPKRLLIDPAYDVGAPALRSELAAFIEGGWQVGLHQSFDAWREPEQMRIEAMRVSEASGLPVTHCRQHWLRFTWSETWKAQAAAGFERDTTLGFNDRPGFRNGAALEFRPWDFDLGSPMRLAAMPMIFMDSHFYDYCPLTPEERALTMEKWLNEVRAVRGQATVNWHTHTVTDAYGWGDGYRQLIELLS